jgi:hypothetical protein
MYSVDLAFDAFLERAGLRAEFQRYCYGGPHRATGMERHVLDYLSLADHFDHVLQSDLILYWGDFQHAYVYWRNALHNGPNRALGFADDRAEMAYMAEHLLLAGQPPHVLRKTLSFGSALVGDDLRALTTVDSAYREAFPSFVDGVRRIWLRDPISAAQAGLVRADRSHSALGVDCSHLLNADDYRSIAGPPIAAPKDYACIFFGRVDAQVDQPAHLAGLVAQAAGLEAVWIPWLGASPNAVAMAQQVIPDLTVEPAPAAYERLIALVAGARLVVTDTYHLCLIAWRLGVPAICVGLGAQRAVRPVSDKKKEIFYLTQRISPLYLFHESIADPATHPAIVAEVLDLALDRTFVEAVAGSLEAQSVVAARDLASTIEACLS